MHIEVMNFYYNLDGYNQTNIGLKFLLQDEIHYLYPLVIIRLI